MLKIKFINLITGEPVPNIILIVKLFAKRKNDYYFDFISNNEGVINIEKYQLQDMIKEEKSMFIMDYTSSLEDCEPKIEISVLSGNEVDRIFYVMTETRSSNNTSNDIEIFYKSVNKQFEPQKFTLYFDGEKNKSLTVAVKPIKILGN